MATNKTMSIKIVVLCTILSSLGAGLIFGIISWYHKIDSGYIEFQIVKENQNNVIKELKILNDSFIDLNGYLRGEREPHDK